LSAVALQDLGTRLLELRTAKGWSRRRLATATGFAPSYIALIETGQRTPSLEATVLLAEMLDAPGHALLFGHRRDHVVADIHPDDRERIVPVEGAVFDRGKHRMAGTNLRVDDVASRFLCGDSIAQLVADWGVGPELIEAALRTAIRSGGTVA
jgi:transcriptional regulator with XRE-family HTH domain